MWTAAGDVDLQRSGAVRTSLSAGYAAGNRTGLQEPPDCVNYLTTVAWHCPQRGLLGRSHTHQRNSRHGMRTVGTPAHV